MSNVSLEKDVIPDIDSIVFVKDEVKVLHVYVARSLELNDKGRYVVANQRIDFTESNALMVIKGRPLAQLEHELVDGANFRIKNCSLVARPDVGYFFIERKYLKR
jgi:hypothetical protein